MHNKIYAKNLLLRMFRHVPNLNKHRAFIEVQLDTCKVYIPIQEIIEGKKEEFSNVVKKLYYVTQPKK